MTIKEFFSFQQNKCFWANIIAIAVVFFLIVFVALKGLDVYTRHGQAVVVPDIKDMGLREAEKLLRNSGLECVVTDSSYVKDKSAGTILDYTPVAGQKVKEGRTIYLTINTIDVPMRSVPDVADNSSMRQAQARLLAVGFKLGEVQYVAGEKDWVYGVKHRGQILTSKIKVPFGATLTLMVGNGGALPQATDSLGADSDGTATITTTDQPAETSDSWF